MKPERILDLDGRPDLDLTDQRADESDGGRWVASLTALGDDERRATGVPISCATRSTQLLFPVRLRDVITMAAASTSKETVHLRKLRIFLISFK